MSGRLRRGLAVAAGLSALAAATLPATAVAGQDATRGEARQTYDRSADRADRVRLDLLAINDFHGNLEPIDPVSSSGRINTTPAGGAGYLATHLDRLRARATYNDAETLTVAAGDLVGASPLLSAAFHDEPTIKALNRMGLDIAAVGNHEFDEGYRELKRLQRGGCLPDGAGEDNQDSCPAGTGFAGAKFQYLAANVIKKSTGNSILKSTTVRDVDGVKVGFIGMTLEGTPDIVSQAGIQGLRFDDEVRTANRLVPRLQERGVESIVVLLHEGGYPADPTAFDGCPNLSGPVVGIADRLDAEIDAVLTGHTHQPYNCSIDDPDGRPRLVTSASSFGRIVSDVHLLLNERTGDVVRRGAWAQNHIVTRDVQLDEGIGNLISLYRDLVEEIASEVIGYASRTVVRTPDPDGSMDSELGNLIADSQRLFDGAVAPGDTGPADVAFMNPGGIRADLVVTNGNEVTYGNAFTVQPFNNYVVSMDMTGQQIQDLLEQQFSGDNAGAFRVLQVSETLTYTWDESEPAGSKVIDSTVEIDGQPVVAGDTYRVIANSFLSDGGDGFSVFTEASDKYVGGLDIDALQEFLTENSSPADPYVPTPTDRIEVQD
ncbi:MAG: bifunctional metallophosphatase/5'-nucleotidase [Nocardioidaceae bacterium]|nr:bifunctional metallophosphatase/5'-nucleotidase [Nocardioidaceae bacterium]